MFGALKSLFRDDDDDELLEEDSLYTETSEKPKKSFFSRKSRTEDDFTQDSNVGQGESSFFKGAHSGGRTYRNSGSVAYKEKESSIPDNVVPMTSARTKGMEVVVKRPMSMDDANEITDTLLSGKAVILNFEGIHVDVAQRLIDYSAGSVYTIRGNFQRITNYIFIITPQSVDLSGDFQGIAGSIKETASEVGEQSAASGYSKFAVADDFRF